jgi:hypothetical protein
MYAFPFAYPYGLLTAGHFLYFGDNLALAVARRICVFL